MALVFTALADSGCALLLWASSQTSENAPSFWHLLDPTQCIAMVCISIGLYGFGMSLNDIIDRRRDQQISPNRPLPSGRIGVIGAHVISAILILIALVAAEVFSTSPGHSHISLLLVVFTAALITYYDFAAKYLVAPGLLALGLIRFLHATIAAPTVPVIWHPLFLLNHVAILSAVAYHWEQKRPALRPAHWWSFVLGLTGLNLLIIGLLAWRRAHHIWPQPNLDFHQIIQILDFRLALLGPLTAAITFCALAFWIRRQNPNPRDAGQTLMLTGLLWLIVYDATFAVSYVSILAGLLILMLLPIAYFSVLVMRWWSKLMLLSQRPEFKRVET